MFLRSSSYSSPPGPNKHLAAHTAQPGSLPRILQQTLHLGWGFRCFGPHAGPGDLIVLKHSSYRQIFQCPLSLVSDLHICWNAIGCSLCSSDQLGVSLVLRGSGLPFHLSRRHLPDLPPSRSTNYVILPSCQAFPCCVKGGVSSPRPKDSPAFPSMPQKVFDSY